MTSNLRIFPASLLLIGFAMSCSGLSSKDANSSNQSKTVRVGQVNYTFKSSDYFWLENGSDYIQEGISVNFDPGADLDACFTPDQGFRHLNIASQKGTTIQASYNDFLSGYADWLVPNAKADKLAFGLTVLRNPGDNEVFGRDLLLKSLEPSGGARVIICDHESLPRPQCEHRIFVDRAVLQLSYHRSCLGRWQDVEALAIKIVREARNRDTTMLVKKV